MTRAGIEIRSILRFYEEFLSFKLYVDSLGEIPDFM